MKHGNLDPEENVLPDEEKEEQIEWDLEDLKQAYIDSAEQQWDKYAGG